MKERLSWPDVSRGLSIIGVLILHVGMAVPYGTETALHKMNDEFAPLRMPLFFLVSGFFAVKVLRMSFVELCTKRLWFLAVPFVFWTPIERWLKAAELHYAYEKAFPIRKVYVEAVLTGQGIYWFLHALIAFTVILWATKFAPVWVSYVIVAVSVLGPGLLLSPWTQEHLPALAGLVGHPYLPFLIKYLCYLPPFLLGSLLRPHIANFAQNAFHPFAMFIAAAGLWMGYSLLHAPEGPWKDTTNIVSSLLFLPLAVSVAVFLGYVPLLGKGIGFIGRHTLQIYIGHQLALTAVFGFFFRYRDEGFALTADRLVDTTGYWVMVCIPIAFAGGLVMHAVQKTPVLGWTMKPPAIAPLVESAQYNLRAAMRPARIPSRETDLE